MLAFDGKKWASQDAATREWFKGLRSPSGIPCCDTSVDDPDYHENEDGSYDVFVKGGWAHVDKNHVLSGTNRIGYAVYWGVPGITYCFMPGARG